MPVYTTVTANGRPSVLLNITRQTSSQHRCRWPTQSPTRSRAADQASRPECISNPFYDQSELVRESIASVRDAILIGLILACIILFLFLRDWTSSLVAGLVIPVTVAVTILFLWIIGESFNLMTLGGLAAAIGLVIDDAIVVVENIVVHRDAGQSRVNAVRKALGEITTPLVFSTITPVVVFLPLIAVTGVTGSFFRALAITMTAALLTSLALAAHLDSRALALSSSAQEQTQCRQSRLSCRSPAHEERPRSCAASSTATQQSAHAGRLARPLLRSALVCVAARHRHLLRLSTPSAPICCPRWTKAPSSSTTSRPPAPRSLRPTACSTHVEQILHDTPEVEITSRRTGLQIGLAAVTEANYGDFTVRLKTKRDRSIDEVIAESAPRS